MSLGQPMPIRAIPSYNGPDLYLDTSKLTSKQSDDLRAELVKQGYHIQYLILEDPTRLLVESEIRSRLEAEQKEARGG